MVKVVPGGVAAGAIEVHPEEAIVDRARVVLERVHLLGEGRTSRGLKGQKKRK